MFRHLLIVVGLLAALPTAADATSIRSDVRVDGPLVTLGDLLSDAGEKADTAVFRAPGLGRSGTISGNRVAEAALSHGLRISADPMAVPAAVTVWRNAMRFEVEDLEAAVRSALKARGMFTSDDAITLEMTSPPEPLFAPMESGARLVVRGLNVQRQGGRFAVQLGLAGTNIPAQSERRLEGRILRTVEVPIAARTIDRLAPIGPDDIRMETRIIPFGSAMPPKMEEVVGQALRRRMASDGIIRSEDLTPPVLVRRNTEITMIYRHGALLLSTKGRALADGVEGDRVKILNARSSRVVEGIVRSDGQVVVTPDKPAMIGNFAGLSPSTSAIAQ